MQSTSECGQALSTVGLGDANDHLITAQEKSDNLDPAVHQSHLQLTTPYRQTAKWMSELPEHNLWADDFQTASDRYRSKAVCALLAR
jgi:hypothetical protein